MRMDLDLDLDQVAQAHPTSHMFVHTLRTKGLSSSLLKKTSHPQLTREQSMHSIFARCLEQCVLLDLEATS